MANTVTIQELREQEAASREAAQEAGAATATAQAEPTPIDPNLFAVPADASFGSGEVTDAPELARIAKEFIDTVADFDWLHGKTLAWYWVRKGGSSGGARTLGNTVKPNKLWRKSTRAVMICWLAADTLRDLRVKTVDVEALVFERLCAIGRDESGKIRREAPDFHGYVKAATRFGPYTIALKRAVDALGIQPVDVRNGRLFEEDGPEGVAPAETPDESSLPDLPE